MSDSFEKIAEDALMDEYSYCEEYNIDFGEDADPAEYSMRRDLISRMEAVAARGYQRRAPGAAQGDNRRDRVETMMKAMISQPMAGKTDGEIAETRERAKAKLEEMGYEFVNTLFTDEWYSDEAMNERGVVQVPLCYLAKSLENMSLCHAVYFAKGWETARGCRIEHDAAVAYGLEALYED